jgi:hypothetical protein
MFCQLNVTPNYKMKAILEFDLTDPDDRSEHKHACFGSAYKYQVIDEILQHLRSKLKYGVGGMTYKDLENKAKRDWYYSADEEVELSNDDVIQYALSRELEEVRDKINECIEEIIYHSEY